MICSHSMSAETIPNDPSFLAPLCVLQGQNDTWQKRSYAQGVASQICAPGRSLSSNVRNPKRHSFYRNWQNDPNDEHIFQRAQSTAKSQGCWKSGMGMAMVRMLFCFSVCNWLVKTSIPFYVADLVDVRVSVELCCSCAMLFQRRGSSWSQVWDFMVFAGKCDKPSMRQLRNNSLSSYSSTIKLGPFLVFGGCTCTIHEFVWTNIYGKSKNQDHIFSGFWATQLYTL